MQLQVIYCQSDPDIHVFGLTTPPLPYVSNGKAFPPGSAAGSRHRHSMTRRLAITNAAY